MPPWTGRTDDGFYRLTDPLSDPPFRGRFEADGQRWAFTRAESRPRCPVPVRWAMGGATPTDVVWTTSAGPMIVGPRVFRVLERGAFTGWDSFPVDLFDRRGRLVDGYVGLSVGGRCGPVDWARSDLLLREYPGGWFPVLRGLFFPPDSWDGSDLCVDLTSNCRYVTARLVRTLRTERIRNLCLEHVAEAEVSVWPRQFRSANQLTAAFEARLDDVYARHGVPRPPGI